MKQKIKQILKLKLILVGLKRSERKKTRKEKHEKKGKRTWRVKGRTIT